MRVSVTQARPGLLPEADIEGAGGAGAQAAVGSGCEASCRFSSIPAPCCLFVSVLIHPAHPRFFFTL